MDRSLMISIGTLLIAAMAKLAQITNGIKTMLTPDYAQINSFNVLFDEIKQWFIEQVANITQQITTIYIALKERLLPLIVEYDVIWQDPLWQIFIAVVLVIILLFIGSRLLSIVSEIVQFIANKTIASIKSILNGLIAPFKWCYGFLQKKHTNNTKTPLWQRINFIQMRRAINALQYLTTKKDWRYNTPWFLVIGENNSGKNALIKAATQGRRTQLLPEEKGLKDPGSFWHFFKHAVVIVLGENKSIHGKTDADETNISAQAQVHKAETEQSTPALIEQNQANLTLPLSLSEQQYNSRFNYLIQLLHWYRPERPVDGIILTISAKTLLQIDQPAVLQSLGENLYRQLWQSQKQTGFVLPVYVVVTESEQIKGFEEFWQAQPESRYNEMIGWSNPYRLECAYDNKWLAQAFTQLLADLESAKLQLAASGQEINNIDKFMLFEYYFNAIQAPLGQILDTTFARSSFQEALPLRGIYFTGKVKNNVSFINDLLNNKVFAEKHLAFPVEKKRFSSQQTLRRFQFSSLIFAALLVILMISDSMSLSSFSQKTQATISRLETKKSDCSPEGNETYSLLTGLTDISERPLLLSMPASWFSQQKEKEQQYIADHIISKILFKSLACRLKFKATQLTEASEITSANNYRAQLQQVTNFSMLLLQYQKNSQHFLGIIKPLDSSKDIDRKLTALLNYLYDESIPKSVNTSASLITHSIKKASLAEQSPYIDSATLLNYLTDNSKNLHTLLLNYAQKLKLLLKKLIKQISETIVPTPKNKTLLASDLLYNIDLLQERLSQTEKNWLTATSPCGKVYKMFSQVQEQLKNTKFNQEQINSIVSQFSEENCDKEVRTSLAKIEISPFSSMFEFNQHKKLVISDALKKVMINAGELEKLNFVKSTYPAINYSSEKIVAWSEAPLQQLLNILINYQAFTSKHLGQSKPFFASNVFNRLQQVSERLLYTAQIHPSQQPFVSYIGKADGSESEAALEKSVTSFKNAQEILMQIKQLLIQVGDSSNAIRLQQTIDKFIIQQLDIADLLVAENKLYQTIKSPKWHEQNFTEALFNISGDKQIKTYLSAQQQRMSFIAYSYVEPLINFLQNSKSPAINNLSAQRWLYTLIDLGRFQRSETGNQIAELDTFISEQLSTNTNCLAYRELPLAADNVGWFAVRKQQLQRQISIHCQNEGDVKIINQYLAIQKHFNKELAGKFPFAKVSQAGINDISVNRLKRFLQYYQQAAKSLLTDMNAYENYKQNSIPTSWYDFISQMDKVNEFFQQHWNNNNKQWQIPLSVQFSAYPEQANGSNQIIEWLLEVGKDKLIYPNGKNRISWQVGQPMSLFLRWAQGSAFLPQPNYAWNNSNLKINPNQLQAKFISSGSWGLFEWLAKYSTDELLSVKANQQNKSLLSFNVPVAMKGGSPSNQDQNITRANILLWVEFTDKNGDIKRLALPEVLPQFAPGFND